MWFPTLLEANRQLNLPKLLLFLSLPLYILDQATKAWTVSNFSEPHPGYFGTQDVAWKIIPDVFHWTRVHNQGVAFGLGNGTAWAPVVFLLVPHHRSGDDPGLLEKGRF